MPVGRVQLCTAMRRSGGPSCRVQAVTLRASVLCILLTTGRLEDTTCYANMDDQVWALVVLRVCRSTLDHKMILVRSMQAGECAWDQADSSFFFFNGTVWTAESQACALPC